MTKLLEAAIEAARRLPEERQDDVARAVLGWIEFDAELVPTNPDDVEAIRRGLAEIRRGEFATDEEVQATFARFRR